MYDLSGGGKDLRKRVFVGLAWWHTMKMAFFAIWRTFADSFIAPSFHMLHPKHQFYRKPSYLSTVIVHCTYIRVAYKSFQNQLTAALATRDLTTRQKNMLRNLQALCEFFIPLVKFERK